MKTLTFIFLTVVIFSHSLWAQKGIVINSGAVLKMNGNVYLKLSGDHNFTNYSTQNQLGGTVVFSGTSEQTISGSEPSEFSNLDINNPNGVILGNDITIACPKVQILPAAVLPTILSMLTAMDIW
jgi:hypothetical protein